MDITYKDFIGTYTNVYPEGYCQYLIDQFERLLKDGAGINRQQGENAPKHRKDDVSLDLNLSHHSIEWFNARNPRDIFFDGLQVCYESYVNEYSILKQNKIHGTAFKMQRTSPGGGYHIWHEEQGPRDNASRVLVYMLYLNTFAPEQAGETEFLYQKTRILPQENTMIIWPAAYTHAHRGNVVHGTEYKYVVTGWFFYE